jgi:hypothetical protein
MSFFGNDAINRVNLQSAIQALAQGAGQLFLLVFLLHAGVPAPIALLAQAAIVSVRFAARPILLPLAWRFGVKPLLLAGTVGLAVQYPLVAEVHGVGPALALVALAAALAEVFYYVSMNTYFAALGDAEHRGSQVAIAQAASAAAGVVAPALGAWALIAAGPRWAFAGVALVQAASVIPLLGLPNLAVARRAPGAWRAARPAALLIVFDGWFDATFVFVWQIALFRTLGQSFAAYGGAMAAAGLVGAAAGLLTGRHVDAGGGRRSIAIGYGAAALVILLRAASLGSPVMAGAANALGALAMPLFVPPLASVTHNIAKASPCPMRVKMATEGGWDVGCFAACLVAAAMAWLHAPAWLGVLLPLPATAASAALLWGHHPAGGRRVQAAR